jgi:hypothetical protein
MAGTVATAFFSNFPNFSQSAVRDWQHESGRQTKMLRSYIHASFTFREFNYANRKRNLQDYYISKIIHIDIQELMYQEQKNGYIRSISKQVKWLDVVCTMHFVDIIIFVQNMHNIC